MSSPLLKLQEASRAFSATEYAVARQILDNPAMVEDLSVHELAKQTFASPSTVVRMCVHAGYSGYKEFRKAVASELLLRQQNRTVEHRELERSDSLEEIVEKVTYKNILSLEQTKSLVDIDVLEKCLEMIAGARYIYLFGLGASLCTAKDAQLKFMRMNKPCFVHEDWHSQLLCARNATDEDLGIVFSYSGQTEEVIECMKAMKANKCPIIAITRCVSTPVFNMADQKLYTTANEAIFRSGAMSSRVSQLNLVDILCTALANSRYEQLMDQFARTHIHKPEYPSEQEI